MKCLVFVKFLPDGLMHPEVFFSYVNAEWCWVEEDESIQLNRTDNNGEKVIKTVRSGICVTDFESIEQLSIDLAIMPGAGILNIEVVPLTGNLNSVGNKVKC